MDKLGLAAAMAATVWSTDLNAESIRVSCQAKPSYSGPAEIASVYADAAFQVRKAPRSGNRCRPPASDGDGTAFLIDEAGYFLTAGHNLSGANPGKYRIRKACPAHLKRVAAEFNVHEVSCGNPGPVRVTPAMFGALPVNQRCTGGDRDFSILKVEFSNDAEKRKQEEKALADIRAIPDLFLGAPYADQFAVAITLLGFASGEQFTDPPWVYQHFAGWQSPKSKWERPQAYLVTDGGSMNGLSGAAALDNRGRIWGINKGPEPKGPRYVSKDEYEQQQKKEKERKEKCKEKHKKCTEKKTELTGMHTFTRITDLAAPLAAVPLSGAPKEFVDGIVAGDLNALANRNALLGRFSHYESYRIVQNVLEGADTDQDGKPDTDANGKAKNKFQAGMKKYPYHLLNIARCGYHTFDMARLGAELARLGVSLTPENPDDRESVLVLANAAYDMGAAFAPTNSVSLANEPAADQLILVRTLFEAGFADMNLVDFGAAEDKLFWGAALARYGLLVSQFGDPDHTIFANANLEKLAATALALAERDWRAALAAAKALRRRMEHAAGAEMALIAMALAEEEETRALQTDAQRSVFELRYVRAAIKSEFRALAHLDDAEIAANTRGLMERYQTGSLLGQAILRQEITDE